TSSNQTLGNQTESKQPSSNETLANQTSNQTPLFNETLSNQARQSLEKQFFRNGTDFFDQGNYASAIKYYDKALILNSTDIYALYNKALALDNLGRLDE